MEKEKQEGENCELPEIIAEDQQENPQTVEENSHGESCELPQIIAEHQQENPQTVEESSHGESCELPQITAEDQQENPQTAEENSHAVPEVVPSSIIVIDLTGQPHEDNVTDLSRREPVFTISDTDSDSDSESTCSSTSVSSLSSFSSQDDITYTPKKTKGAKPVNSMKTHGELGIEDLPPVEELTISVPEDDVEKIGIVYQIVDQIVVIQSYENSRPLDVDTVLFMSHERPLGHIFDVIGPVKQPYYLIRFNSHEDIVKKEITKGDSVFYAPTHSNITGFIFVADLMKQKGSDASWEHNNEPPEEHLDYSDDEQERAARRRRAAKNRKPDTYEADNSKIINLSSDDKSDTASTISSTSSTSRSILRPSANLHYHSYHPEVSKQNMATPRYRFSQNHSFSESRPRPFSMQQPFASSSVTQFRNNQNFQGHVQQDFDRNRTNSPQQSLTSPATASHRGNNGFPASGMSFSETHNRKFLCLPMQVCENTLTASQFRTPANPEFYRPRLYDQPTAFMQRSVSPAPATFAGNPQFPSSPLPFRQVNSEALRMYGQTRVSENIVPIPNNCSSEIFAFPPPRLPQPNPVPPAVSPISGIHPFPRSSLAVVQRNNQEHGVSKSAPFTPQLKIPDNFVFSQPNICRPPPTVFQPRLSRPPPPPPPPAVFQQRPVPPPPGVDSGDHHFSSLPFGQPKIQQFPYPAKQIKDTVEASHQGVSRNIAFSQVRPPQPSGLQQNFVSPAPVSDSSHLHSFSSQSVQANNQSTMTTPQHSISGNFTFPAPRPLTSRPPPFLQATPRQSLVPSSPVSYSGVHFSGSSTSFVRPSNQTFNAYVNPEVSSNPAAALHQTTIHQKPISPAPPSSMSHQLPSFHLPFTPPNNQRS